MTPTPSHPDHAADPNDVAAITVDRDSHVEVAFADGRVCRYELVELRVACPCAGCRNAREQGREPWRYVAGRPELAIADAELVGAWGLGITWNDGHSTGIYPFESLRRWCEAGTSAAAFAADSGL